MSGRLAGDERFDAILALLERAQVSAGPPGMQEAHGTAAESADRVGWDHTLFAPTDEAFAALGQQIIDCMFDAEQATGSEQALRRLSDRLRERPGSVTG